MSFQIAMQNSYYHQFKRKYFLNNPNEFTCINWQVICLFYFSCFKSKNIHVAKTHKWEYTLISFL